VVIAIIGILASLLLPALRQARGKAMTMQCTANVRQFVVAMATYVNDDGYLPPHQQSNLVPDGMLMPNWANLVKQGYVPVPDLLICRTAPLKDYPWKYSSSTDATDRTAGQWASFYSGSSFVNHASKALDKLDNPGYNKPMGTYYYWGGGEHRIPDKSIEAWTSHRFDHNTEHYRMSPVEIHGPAQYAIIWDQDRFRNYLHGRPEQMPHMRYTPGRTFGYWDGHAVFEEMSFDPTDDASYYTPVMKTSYTIRYMGTNYGTSNYRAGTDGILRLRTVPVGSP
jgi:type II secretory pathway pseudopilin PulG